MLFNVIQVVKVPPRSTVQMHFSIVLLTLGLLSQVICSSTMCCESAPGSKFVILLSVVTSAFGAKPRTNNPLARIIGGTATPITKFPWQISLQRNGFPFCGGSIYSTKIILTAAHCLESETVAQLQVRAGSNTWSFGGSLIQVAAIKWHEKYNSNTMIFDIGIILLKTALKTSDSIKIIPLAEKTPAEGTTGSVSGWGTTAIGSHSFGLQYVDVKIISQKTCASSTYGYGDKIKDHMFCTYSTGKDSCQGDSGGPLAANGVLVGVVSWGIGCARKNFPGVYSDVAVLRPWIISNVKSLK